MTASAADTSIGKLDFIRRHGLWTDEQHAAAERAAAIVAETGLRNVRVSVGDPHGKLRGKTVLAGTWPSVLRNGLDFATALYHFDTADGIVYNPFTLDGGVGVTAMGGFPDAVLVPDPTTFRVLPWAPGTAWCLGDVYFDDGTPVPFDSRGVLRRALADLHAEAGQSYLAGLEVEFYLTRLVDRPLDLTALGGPGQPPDPPSVAPLAHGYAYQSEDHQDQIEDILAVLADNLLGVGLPLRTMEDEWGPGQCEFTFHPQSGMDAADSMLLFRSAVKQVARRLGLHASFMCRPALPSFYANGWHLHQSLVGAAGINTFAAPESSDAPLSEVGLHWLGGLLAHAGEGSVFTTPTVNGYRRRKPFSLAPDRSTWGLDNRAAMLRVQGGAGDPSTHVENRIGEPAANPYLYLASQVVAGLDGLRHRLDPGPPEAEPYGALDRPLLPATLVEALAEVKTSALYRSAFGDAFVDWYIGLKEFELARFVEAEPGWEERPDEVTAWEHREYFAQY